MDEERWLVGWREIGEYVGRSARTAHRWARDGMPFLRDPAGRPIAKPSLIDRYFLNLNRNYAGEDGIKEALRAEAEKERERKDFTEGIIAAQRPPRGRF